MKAAGLLDFVLLRWQRMPPVYRGILMMLLSAAFATSTNSLIRIAAADVHAFEVEFFRGLFGLVLMGPALKQVIPAVRVCKRRGLLFSRGLLQTAQMLGFFLAVTMVPLRRPRSC